MKGEVPRRGTFDDVPTSALFTLPFMGRAGEGPSWMELGALALPKGPLTLYLYPTTTRDSP